MPCQLPQTHVTDTHVTAAGHRHMSQAHVTARHMPTQTPIPCPTWKESSSALMKSSETSEMWARPVKVLLCSSTKAPKGSRRLILPFTTSPFFRSPMSVQLPPCLSFSVISTLQASHDSDPALDDGTLHRFTPATKQASASVYAMSGSRGHLLVSHMPQNVIICSLQCDYHCSSAADTVTQPRPASPRNQLAPFHQQTLAKGSGPPVASHAHNPAFHQSPNRQGNSRVLYKGS